MLKQRVMTAIVLLAILLPALFYPTAMPFCAVALVLIAGVDVYLLQTLAGLAKETASLIDDAVFTSELTIALYVLPVVFGGIGVNLISHVLLRHRNEAEGRFDREHGDE